jgi:hypothetical protein
MLDDTVPGDLQTGPLGEYPETPGERLMEMDRWLQSAFLIPNS